MCCTTCSLSRSLRSRRSSTVPPRRQGSSRAGRGAGSAGRCRRPTAISPRQREVVDAFLAASRAGDFDALIAVLDPGVVFRARGTRELGAVGFTVTAGLISTIDLTLDPGKLEDPDPELTLLGYLRARQGSAAERIITEALNWPGVHRANTPPRKNTSHGTTPTGSPSHSRPTKASSKHSRCCPTTTSEHLADSRPVDPSAPGVELGVPLGELVGGLVR